MQTTKETLYQEKDRQQAVNFVAFWITVLLAVIGLGAACVGEKWIPIVCLLIAVVAGYFTGASQHKYEALSSQINNLKRPTQDSADT